MGRGGVRHHPGPTPLPLRLTLAHPAASPPPPPQKLHFLTGVKVDNWEEIAEACAMIELAAGETGEGPVPSEAAPAPPPDDAAAVTALPPPTLPLTPGVTVASREELLRIAAAAKGGRRASTAGPDTALTDITAAFQASASASQAAPSASADKSLLYTAFLRFTRKHKKFANVRVPLCLPPVCCRVI